MESPLKVAVVPILGFSLLGCESSMASIEASLYLERFSHGAIWRHVKNHVGQANFYLGVSIMPSHLHHSFYHVGMVLIVIGQGKIWFETLFQRSWDDLSTRPDIHSWSIDFLGMAPSMDWFSWENLQENSVAEDRGFYLEIFPGEKHRRAEHDSKSGPQKSGRPRCSVQPRAGWNS